MCKLWARMKTSVLQMGRWIFLVMEFCGGGDLAGYIRGHPQISEATARHFVQQLGHGLKEMWLNNFVHVRSRTLSKYAPTSICCSSCRQPLRLSLMSTIAMGLHAVPSRRLDTCRECNADNDACFGCERKSSNSMTSFAKPMQWRRELLREVVWTVSSSGFCSAQAVMYVLLQT